MSCCCCVVWLGLKAWKLARCLESSHSLANSHFHGLYLNVSCECQPCTSLSVVFVLWVRFWIVPMAVRASLFPALQIGSDAGLNRNLSTCSVLKVLYVDKHKCTSGNTQYWDEANLFVGIWDQSALQLNSLLVHLSRFWRDQLTQKYYAKHILHYWLENMLVHCT